MEYPKISNKTVRKNEHYLATYFHKEGGTLKKTNRGYFLDGIHISVFSAQDWLSKFGVMHNGSYRPAKVYRKRKDPMKSVIPDWERDMRDLQIKRRKEREAAYQLAVGPTLVPKGDW